jgi:hypothetical protein
MQRLSGSVWLPDPAAHRQALQGWFPVLRLLTLKDTNHSAVGAVPGAEPVEV